MKEKNGKGRESTAARYVVAGALVCLQGIVFCGNPSGFPDTTWFRGLDLGMTGLCALFLAIACRSVYRTRRAGSPWDPYTVLGCVGGAVAILRYQSYLHNMDGGLALTRRFLLGPYAAALLLSVAVWFLTEKTGWVTLERSKAVWDAVRPLLRKLAHYALWTVALVSLLTAGYMAFRLESYLLAGWALLTGCCACGCARKAGVK